ncbi:hypothetical protein, partial [Bacteroides ovatus]|uniref:hypothetical protein n=1 Tax=Bacteroides ovatus TaxID=28116 RepID=UPI001C70A3AC
IPDFLRKHCPSLETPEDYGARSITSARARRTAKGAYFHNTNPLKRKHRKTTPHGCTSRKRSVPIVRRKEVAD